jgi:uncharacterized protein (DUF1697 family)
VAETFVALLRGINVGKAKRIAMAELRALVESLGHGEVRTLLNSGNVVFKARAGTEASHGKALSAAIEKKFGFSVAVVVVSAPELGAIIKASPREASDPARYLVAFAPDAATLGKAKPLLKQSWAPDSLALGKRAAYAWCASGIADSKLLLALSRATDNQVTARNWATVLKLQEMTSP